MNIRCVRGTHRIEVRDANGKVSHAKLKIKFGRIKVLPPIGKYKRYPALPLTVIYAYEAKAPKGRERIEWKLLTNLPVRTLREAIEKLDWYAMRWKIETFHKILKSGCRAEESKLRAAQRLTNLLSIYCILAWRIFWLCMINRAMPDGSASLVLMKTERQIMGFCPADS